MNLLVKRPDDVPAAFDGVAEHYDAPVGKNPGYHRHLRISADRMSLPAGGCGPRLLDAGCRTDACTAALLAAAGIVPAGRIHTGGSARYGHLRRSVNEFDGTANLRERRQRNHFEEVHSQTMTGWQRNVVHRFLGRAPQ